jgi:predicted NACHT family NTPase
MVKRSLQATSTGIKVAKKTFADKGWTQDGLAFEVGIKTRQPIWRFFTGKPVERHVFIEICALLEIDWREIADNPPAESGDSTSRALDTLVKKVRSLRYEKLQFQCGTFNLLDMNKSVNIGDVYIDLNILEKVASKQWMDITNLQQIDADQFERFGMGDIAQSQISGMEAVKKYARLRVLGKPGIGKTTFLKHLAIQCNLGNFNAHQVAIFIPMQVFAQASKRNKEFNLLTYIREEFATSGIVEPNTIETLLHDGRAMLLMDGLDEVLSEDSAATMKEIRRISSNYFKNQFIAACRTASQKLSLEDFTDVEIAPFTAQQIHVFAQKWFVALSTPKEGKLKSAEFIAQLEEPINWQYRRMVNTPLFLHLACWLFAEEGGFPAKRSEFYRMTIDLLLGRWDRAKGVDRDQIYPGFLLPQKLRLVSQIAAESFEEGKYFMPQHELEAYIGDFLRGLPNASSASEEIESDSESVLRSIESQDGLLAERAKSIFSFSYLAFHEYLTARKIVANYNLLASGKTLPELVSHISEPRWHEIFLLTASMLRSADGLIQLMKKQIDHQVQQDPYLQEFLTWASQKSTTTPKNPKVAMVRAFYLALSRSPHSVSQFALASTLDQGMVLDASLDRLLSVCAIDLDISHARDCGETLKEILVTILDVALHKALEQLSDRFPNYNLSSSVQRERLRQWWKDNYQTWAEELRQAIAFHRNLNLDWHFSLAQQEVLQRYYDGNQLLLECLNTNSEITTAVREEVEATLLLSQDELEAHEWK